MKGPTKQTVSEWADDARYLAPESSAEPGKWFTSRAPYLRGIMDAFTDPTVKIITFIKSAQTGGSEVLLNILGYIVDNDPGPALLVQPSLDEAKHFSKVRLEPMFRDSPTLRGKLSEKYKSADNTTLNKRFTGGYIAIKGANSASGLSSRPIRYAIFDEVSRYEPSANGEGDPVALGVKRTTTFWNAKVVYVSTPKVYKACRITAAWEESDKRKYYVPCPHCGGYQTLYFTVEFERDEEKKKPGGLKWDKDEKGNHLTHTVYYECEHCGERISEDSKDAMLDKGEWRASEESKGNAGFHINEIYSPWVRWKKIVDEFLEVKHSRDKSRMQVFVNTVLGEAFKEKGDSADKSQIMSRREVMEKLPHNALVLTASIDVQDNRLEYMVYAWGRGYERWAVEYGFFFGDTLDEGPNGPWYAIGQKMLDFRMKRNDEITLRVQAIACDSGHRTQQAYRWCMEAQRNGLRAYPIKGISGEDTKSKSGDDNPVVKLSKNRKVMLVYVDVLKKELYDFLQLTEYGPGYVHFPIKDGFDENFFEQLTSEERKRKFINNFPVYYWKKKDAWARNEVLDLTVYCHAALVVLKPNFDALDINLRNQSIEIQKAGINGEERTTPQVKKSGVVFRVGRK